MPKLAGLQILRGCAALMVLVGHIRAEAEHYFAVPLPGGALPWTRGVDVFFVISGFIITLSARRFVNRPLAFLGRRIWRVVPLYYVFTTLMVATLILAPGAIKDTAFDPAQILHSYGFLPHVREDGRIAPVLSLGWTLNYEMFFYILVTIAILLPNPMLWVGGALFALAGLGLIVRPESTMAAFWTNPLIVEFGFGIVIAQFWLAGWRRPSLFHASFAGAAACLLLIFLHQTGLPRFIAAGLPAALLIAAATLLWPEVEVPNLGLGDASYALYLSHRFVLRGATILLLPLLPGGAAGATIFVALALLLCIGGGIFTYRHIEQPLTRWPPRLRRASQKAAA
jgi:exopolysaccharide production protein ExoZ